MSTKRDYRQREAERRRKAAAASVVGSATGGPKVRDRIAATVLIISMLLVSIAGALALGSTPS